MARKTIFIIVFAAIGAGVLGVRLFVGQDIVKDHFGIASARLAAASSYGLDIAIETFIGSQGILSVDGEALALPFALRGSLAVALPDDGSMRMDGMFRAGIGTESDTDGGTIGLRLDREGDLYLRFTELPLDLGPDVSAEEVEGLWLKMDSATLLAFFPSFGMMAGAGGPEEGAASVSARTVRSVLAGRAVASPEARYEDTVIDGKPMAHYTLLLDKDGIAGLIEAFGAQVTRRPLTEDEVRGIRERVETTTYAAEAWVDKVKGEFSFIKLVVIPESGSGRPFTVTVRLTGTDVVVDADTPPDAGSMATVFGKLLKTTTQ